MELSGKLAPLDGIITPFVCDVMRNLSGVLRSISPSRYAKFFDQPQDFSSKIGGEYYEGQLKNIINHFNGEDIPKNKLLDSILLYDENRRLIREFYDVRSDRPWSIPLTEAYLLLRAGLVIDVKEHNKMLKEYMESVKKIEKKPEDNVRVILAGVFCEQPPLPLLKVIEQGGCYVVSDDLFLGGRYLTNKVDVAKAEKDPIKWITDSYSKYGVTSPCRFEGNEERETSLIKEVRERNAQGVIFAAPSFCDPALEERPLYQSRLDGAGIKHISFLYSEDTAQFSTVREQIGTFTDSIKIWG